MFRAFGIALGLPQLMIAALGLFLVWGGHQAIEIVCGPTAAGLPETGPSLGNVPFSRLAAAFLSAPFSILFEIASQWHFGLRPLSGMTDPLMRMAGSRAWGEFGTDLLRLGWNGLVWSLCGGALARMAAVRFARGERLGAFRALLFSADALPRLVFAPALPILGLGLLWAVNAGIGVFGGGLMWGDVASSSPWSWFTSVPILVGFFFCVILIPLAVGWPLMVAAVSVEQADGFDAMSRAYNYVYDRPWHTLWFMAVILTWGAISLFIVGAGLQFVRELAFANILWSTNSPLRGTHPSAAFGGDLAWWVRESFLHSYFWTAATIAYLLLRESSDGTDLRDLDHQARADRPLELKDLRRNTPLPASPPTSDAAGAGESGSAMPN